MSMLSFGVIFLVAGLAVTQAEVWGSLTSNSRGGQDYNMNFGRQFGSNTANFGGGVYAGGNTAGGGLTRGGFVAANMNGFSASISKSKTDNYGSTLEQNFQANLLKNDKHQLDAIAFHSRTNLDNGFNFNRVGGGLDYNTAKGHGASVTVSRIPQLNMNTVDVQGKVNLLKSQDKSTTLDLTGTISKHSGGPLDGQMDKRVDLKLTKRF
uniref:Attacin C-terminal domain-containing protein n=1 Tax=Musca domestica TaxID=7370 RepID=A0A1I8NJV1_MUSDO